MLWGVFLALLASISWGAMFPVANHSFKYIDSFYFTIFRYIPVALILIIILLVKEGKEAFHTDGRGFYVWFFGTMGFTIYNLFIFWGQEMLGETGTLLASIMESLSPMVSVLIIWMLSRRRPSAFTLFSIGIAFLGVVLVVTNGDLGFLSNLHKQLFPLGILFFGIVGWVVYTMGGGRFPDWSILRYSTLTLTYGIVTTTGIVFLTTLFGLVEAPKIDAIYAVRYDMIFMVIFPGVIALLGWNEGVRILEPINSLLFLSFVPVTTLVIGYVQGYNLTLYDVVGTAFIVLALLLNNIYQRILLRKRSINNSKKVAYKQSATTSS